MKQKQIVVGLGLLVNDKNQVLISLRNDPGSNGEDDKWEIPGGGVEFGETIKQTVTREMKEELGVDISFLDYPPIVRSHVWKYPDIHVQVILIGYICKTTGTPRPANEEVADVRWVAADEIDSLDYLPLCDVFVKKVTASLTSSRDS